MKAPIFAALAFALVALAPPAAGEEPLSFSNEDFKDLPGYDAEAQSDDEDEATRAVEERRKAGNAEAESRAAMPRARAAEREPAGFDDQPAPADPTSSEWSEGTEEERARLKSIVGRPAVTLSSASFWTNSEPIDLAKSRGKIFVLCFWSTDHERSKLAVPALNALQDRYRDEDVVVVAICGNDRTGKRPADIAQEMGIRCAACWDNNALLSMAYEVNSLPDYAIVDHTGTLFAADLRDAAIEPAVRAAIARRKAAR